MKPAKVILASLLVFLLLPACVMPSPQPKVEIPKAGYTAQSAAKLEKDFQAQPEKFSQQMGVYLLWRMNQASPEFAREFAQIPELNDGISPEEVRAMQGIYSLVSRVKIPQELLGKEVLPNQGYEFVVKWKGISAEEKKIKIILGNTEYKGNENRITGFEPIELEPNDSVEFNKSYGFLIIVSNTKTDDVDGVAFVQNNLSSGELLINFNHNLLSIPVSQIYSNNIIVLQKNSFGYDIGGEVIISPPEKGKSPYTSGQKILANMVNMGGGDKRYSAPMQAMFWLYVDGRIDDPSDPFRKYANTMHMIKDAWGDMKGPRWSDFGEVTSRLNRPELINIWIAENLVKVQGDGGRARMPEQVFREKKAFCLEAALFGVYSLKKNTRYDAKLYWDMSWPKQDYAPSYALSGHTVAAYPLPSGDMHVFVDWGPGNINIMKIVSQKDFQRLYRQRGRFR